MTTARLAPCARHATSAGLAAFLLAAAPAAFAQAGEPRPAEPAPPAAAADTGATKHRLNWNYPRFRLWQYIASGSVTLTGFYLQYGIEGNYPDGSWDNGILFDDAIRGALVAESQEGRLNAHLLGDYFWHIPQYFPVVESIVLPLVTDKLNFDVAVQLTLINWQAQGLSFLLTRLGHRTVGRARPSLQECARDPEYDGACQPDAQGRTASFISGHTSMAMAGASLTCAHHQALPLYGGNAADIAICAVAVAAATTNGVLRIIADKHWATDVLAGMAVGAGTGYLLPYLLHYRYGRLEPVGAAFLPPNTALVPLVSEQSLGLALTGLF
jgi:membrane-associated phospholipid phosphatase